MLGTSGVAKENTPKPPPPEIGKNCCRKILFQKALFLITFPQIVKNTTFPLNFHQKNSQQFVFRPNVRKYNAVC